MSYQENRHRVYGVAETTPGVDPAVGVGSMTPLPVESSEPSYAPEFKERGVIGAAGPGQADTLVNTKYGYKCRIGIYPVAVVDANTRMLGYLLLRAAGLAAPSYAAGPPKRLRMERGTVANPFTITLYEYLANDDGTAWRTKRHGCRGNGKLTWSAKDDLAIEIELNASGGSEDSQSLPSAPSYIDSNSASRLGLSGVSATIDALETIDGLVSYEGCMTSGELDLGMDHALLRGIPVGAGGDTGPTRSTPSKSKGKVTIEMKSDFNPRSIVGKKAVITPRFVATDDSDDSLTFPIYCQITDAQRAYEEGFGMWTLSFNGLWIPVSPSTEPGETEGTTLQMDWKSA